MRAVLGSDWATLEALRMIYWILDHKKKLSVILFEIAIIHNLHARLKQLVTVTRENNPFLKTAYINRTTLRFRFTASMQTRQWLLALSPIWKLILIEKKPAKAKSNIVQLICIGRTSPEASMCSKGPTFSSTYGVCVVGGREKTRKGPRSLFFCPDRIGVRAEAAGKEAASRQRRRTATFIGNAAVLCVQRNPVLCHFWWKHVFKGKLGS